MARPGAPFARSQHSVWLSAVICVGCAHLDGAHRDADASTKELDPAIAALRRDNAQLRRNILALEDRVVKLERSNNALPIDRELPVVRLEPPPEPVESAAPAPAPAPSVRPKRHGSRVLGNVPGSAADGETWREDEPSPAAAEPGASTTAPGRSYRLVGNRLVELTKKNAPKGPDRPARDAKGNAVLLEYEAAMALYKAGELGGAERAFELFARAHPKHDYADNALYWKGEAAYDQSKWDGALAAFTEVVERYGGGNKAPDALLKIGLCYGKLGDSANARDVFSELVAAYPEARASDIARARLGELES